MNIVSLSGTLLPKLQTSLKNTIPIYHIICFNNTFWVLHVMFVLCDSLSILKLLVYFSLSETLLPKLMKN